MVLRLVAIIKESSVVSVMYYKGINKIKEERGDEILNDGIINMVVSGRCKYLERDMTNVGW